MTPLLIDLAAVLELIRAYGLWLIAPLAVLEGPIVTVVAGYFASLGLLDLAAVAVVVVLGDLAGDVIMYGIGRRGPRVLPESWRRRLRLDEGTLATLETHFREKGGRTLVIAKLTHSLGAVALVAAGAARMNFWAFCLWNFLATLPKSAGFLALGWTFGAAYARVDRWIFWGSFGLLAALLGAGFIWWRRRRRA